MTSQFPKEIKIHPDELVMTFVRSGGPGGQNVNKVSTAVQLRFDIVNSPSITSDVKQRLLALVRNRCSAEGVLVIHANRYRTQEQNREDAVARLHAFIEKAMFVPKARKATKPTYSSSRRRVVTKKQHGQKKMMRGRSVEREEE